MGSDEYFDCIKDINPIFLQYHGRGYVIDYCVSALKKKKEEFLYRTYVTDALQAIASNTAHYVGESGIVMTSRYAEKALSLKENNKGKPKKEKTITAEEVIDNLKNKLTRLGSKKENK
jgi:hypothetical protein